MKGQSFLMIMITDVIDIDIVRLKSLTKLLFFCLKATLGC